jgi:hypothetical protein
MEFTIAKLREIAGSGHIGVLKATGAQIIKKFGMPHSQIPNENGEYVSTSADGKVRYEWDFKSIDNKAIITIYDYKDDRPFKEINDWRVGGKGKRDLIQKFFDSYFPNVEFEWDKR